MEEVVVVVGIHMEGRVQECMGLDLGVQHKGCMAQGVLEADEEGCESQI